MPVEHQRYKIEIIKTIKGEWRVAGYWEIPYDSHNSYKTHTWDLDGAIKHFKTYKDALEFCMNITGVPV